MMQKFIFLFAIYMSFSQIQFCKGSNNSFDISIGESFEFAPITPSPENTNKETPYLTPIGQRYSDYHDQECMAFYILENLDKLQQENETTQKKSNNTISSDEDITGTRPAVSPRHFQENSHEQIIIIKRLQNTVNIPEEPIDTCWTSFRKKIKLLLHLKS